MIALTTHLTNIVFTVEVVLKLVATGGEVGRTDDPQPMYPRVDRRVGAALLDPRIDSRVGAALLDPRIDRRVGAALPPDVAARLQQARA